MVSYSLITNACISSPSSLLCLYIIPLKKQLVSDLILVVWFLYKLISSHHFLWHAPSSKHPIIIGGKQFLSDIFVYQISYHSLWYLLHHFLYNHRRYKYVLCGLFDYKCLCQSLYTPLILLYK